MTDPVDTDTNDYPDGVATDISAVDALNGESNAPNRQATAIPDVLFNSTVSETVWTDNTGAFFIRVNTNGVITWAHGDGTPTVAPNSTGHPV